MSIDWVFLQGVYFGGAVLAIFFQVIDNERIKKTNEGTRRILFMIFWPAIIMLVITVRILKHIRNSTL
ncbi:MAG: hypothetical protein DRN14_05350 [Thermoplasmata archaeon]|nr:MAG: hypothetical protein DRN14_05350 [Thermoplasmata archaeon]